MPIVDARLGHDPHRVRPVHPAGVRLLPRAPAARARLRRRQVPGRHRGHARRRHRGDRAAGRVAAARSRSPCSATRTCRPRRTPCPALLPHQPVALEGMDARLVDVVRAPARAAAVPDLPRGEGWLFVETAGATEAEARRRRREARSPTPAASTRRSSPAPAAARAVAHPRGRRRPRRPHARRRARLAGLGGRRRPARPARRLPARVRRRCCASTASTGSPTATSATAACTSASTSRSPTDAGARFREFVAAAAQLVGRHGGSMSGEHGDGRARGELLPLHVLARGDRGLRRGQARSSTRRNLLNPGVIVDPRAGRRRPAGAGRPGRCASTSASPTRTTAATCPPPCTAASASASAGRTPPRPAA